MESMSTVPRKEYHTWSSERGSRTSKQRLMVRNLMSLAALPFSIGRRGKECGNRQCLNELNKFHLLLRTDAMLARGVSTEYIRQRGILDIPSIGAASNTVKSKAPTARRFLTCMVKILVGRIVKEICGDVEQESAMVWEWHRAFLCI